MRAFASAIAAVCLLGSCTSPEDRAMARLHELDAQFDELEAKFDQLVQHANYLSANCTEGPSCERQKADTLEAGRVLIDQIENVARQQERAERDLDYASAAADRRAARGAAMMGAGAALLGGSQPRQPVICQTSNTTIPTTVCQ